MSNQKTNDIPLTYFADCVFAPIRPCNFPTLFIEHYKTYYGISRSQCWAEQQKGDNENIALRCCQSNTSMTIIYSINHHVLCHVMTLCVHVLSILHFKKKTKMHISSGDDSFLFCKMGTEENHRCFLLCFCLRTK